MAVDTSQPFLECTGYGAPSTVIGGVSVLSHAALYPGVGLFQVLAVGGWDEDATKSLADAHWRTCLHTRLLPWESAVRLSISAGSYGIRAGGAGLIFLGRKTGASPYMEGNF